MNTAKHRDRRFIAILQGVMAEVALAGVLLVWLNHPDSASQAAFGAVGSPAVLMSSLVMTAAVTAVLVLRTHVRRTIAITLVSVTSLVLAGVGVLAFVSLFTDPGVTVLLGFGWALSVLSTVAFIRARTEPTPSSDRTRR